MPRLQHPLCSLLVVSFGTGASYFMSTSYLLPFDLLVFFFSSWSLVSPM